MALEALVASRNVDCEALLNAVDGLSDQRMAEAWYGDAGHQPAMREWHKSHRI